MSLTINNKIGRRFVMPKNNHLIKILDGHNGPSQVRNLRYLRTLRPNANTIIDVGAHCGLNTIEYATWCQVVQSFEPNPQTYQDLQTNIAWNTTNYQAGVGWYEHSKKNWATLQPTAVINTYNQALGNTIGTATLVPNNNSLADYVRLDNAKSGVQVQLNTIDDFQFQQVDIIKMDTEGTEWLVVQGATNTIQTWRPIVQVEMWNWEKRFGLNNQDMLDHFRSLNYKHTDNKGNELPWDASGKVKYCMDRFFIPN